MKRYKFLRKGFKSDSGNLSWKIGEWKTCKEELDICNVGLHCSKGVYQAFSYVQGEILAEVEVGGKSIKQSDKEAWEKMRIVKAWKWKKADSVSFSIYAARLVLDKFEDVYPNDDRPRKAIEVAERYLKNPTIKNRRVAAEAAAGEARATAEETAWAAEAAARAAGATARAAGAAAEAAARAAAWAAARAAEAATYKKLDRWMLNHIKELENIKA